MKHLSVTAVALAAFSLPSPALAQTATGCPGNTESTNELESQVEETMMTISCRVRMQQSIPFDLNRLEDLAGRWIDRCPDEDVPGGQTRTSFLRFARHLEELARSTFLRMNSVAELEIAFVEARLDRAIATLEQGTRAGGGSADSYTRVLRLLHERAELTSDELDALEIRRRLESLLDQTLEQIASGGGSMDPLRRELDRPRLRRQVSPGQAAAAAGESTTVRQLRIAELLHVRDDLSGGEGPQD